MLSPAKTKYRKMFKLKGSMSGLASRGNQVTVGEYGLQTLERCNMTGNQIEAARKVIVRETGRKGKLWLRIFPSKPVTNKPAEVRMGSGKGDVVKYVAVVKPGKLLFELGGVDLATAKLALEKASAKLPVKTKFIVK